MISRKTYLWVAVALIVLLALTAWLSKVDLGVWNVWAAMLIAVAKAMLVVTFFMEMKVSPRLMWLAAAMGVFWLGLLVGGILIDVGTRLSVLPH